MAAVWRRLAPMMQRKIARNSPLLLEINRYFGNRIILSRLLCGNIIDRPDAGPQIPPYKAPENEPMNLKRARLLYQSRKRGMSENGLLLSTFANQHLNDMDDSMLAQYDKLINQPSNDWELYYWMTEAKPTPEEFEGPVMDMLKRHAKNENMDVRIRQPDLKPVQE